MNKRVEMPTELWGHRRQRGLRGCDELGRQLAGLDWWAANVLNVLRRGRNVQSERNRPGAAVCRPDRVDSAQVIGSEEGARLAWLLSNREETPVLRPKQIIAPCVLCDKGGFGRQDYYRRGAEAAVTVARTAPAERVKAA